MCVQPRDSRSIEWPHSLTSEAHLVFVVIVGNRPDHGRTNEMAR